MGRSCFLRALLLLALLVLSFSHGYGRKLMEKVDQVQDSSVHVEETQRKSRELMEEVMDYEDPGPNTNTKTGFITSPPQV